MAVSVRGVKTRYEVKEVIARGGMGIVYKAYDKVMKRPVALKTLLDLTDPTAIQLFQKECEDLASLIHPNIIEIFDVGQLEDESGVRPYLVMALLPGLTLDKLISTSSSRLSVERCVDIFCQTCRGLQAAHERGLIHRDLKPSNIFVMEDDSVKIIDFGVARRVASSHSVGRKGTPMYMSPEQILMRPLTPASDIFSLGVVCYEALTRRRPFGEEGADEAEINEAILHDIPAPVHQLNTSVSPALSQAIHKALAKNAIHRYRSAKEFGDVLQRAVRNEQIDLFNPARIQVRLERARSAYEKGDYEFAGEIISELESEGYLDTSVTELKAEMKRARSERRVSQLIETARSRMEEKEYQIALQKINEALELDPKNTEALSLQAKVDGRRTDQDVEGWYELARSHMANGAFAPAREALKRILQLRPREPKATHLLSEVERSEQNYARLRAEKEALYRAAIEADRNGDISSAITNLERVLEMDKRAPEPSRTGTYQRLYDKVRTDHDTIKNARAEAKRLLDDKKFSQALGICTEYLAKYPADTLFQALKYDIEEKQRQAMSARIAETDQSVEAEPDLDRRLSILERALQENPETAHFELALQNARDKRDMVNGIVARARACEEKNQLNEALAQWEILNTIYPRYPGLPIEIERVNKRRENLRRQETKARWVEQIDQQLEARDFERASELVRMADEELPSDPELAELGRVAQQGLRRHIEARQLLEEGQAACERGDFDLGIEALRRSYELDWSNTGTRTVLVETLVEQGRRLMEKDAERAQMLLNQALEIEPNHTLAKGLLKLITDQQKVELIDGALARVRRLQAEGDLEAAGKVMTDALRLYPGEQRLLHVQSSLGRAMQDIRRRDLERAKRIAREVDTATAVDEERRSRYVNNLDKYLTKYREDEEFQSVVHSARRRLETICEPVREPVFGYEEPDSGMQSIERDPESAALPRDPIATFEDRHGAGSSPELGEMAPVAASQGMAARMSEWSQRLSRRTILRAAGLTAAVIVLIAAGVITNWKKNTVTNPPPPVMGSLEITTSPSDSAIFVDGVEVGHAGSQLNIEKRKGTYEVAVRHRGYETQHRRIALEPGKKLTALFSLAPENPTLRVFGAGRVTVDSDPPVDIADGQYSRALAPGEHTVLIAMNHLASASFKVEVGREGLPVVSDVTAKEVNPLVLSNFGGAAKIYGANNAAVPVYLSGNNIGRLDPGGLELPSLAANVYTVVLGEGKDAKSRQIEIGPSRTISAFLEADPNVGTLVVQTNEDDATVVLSYKGREYARRQTKNGQAHFANVRVHPYVVETSKAGYEVVPDQQETDIKKGAETNLSFELRKKPSATTIKVASTPEAEIFIDGSPAGKTGADGLATIPNVGFGRHRIEARRKGYASRSTELIAAETDSSSVELRLSRALGTVRISKNVPEAVVNYKKIGDSTSSLALANSLQLPEGNYVFTASAPRHVDAEASVAIIAGEESEATLKLVPVPPIEIRGIEAAWGKNFAQPTPGDWYVHKGEGFIGLSRPGPGVIQFTAPLTKGRAFGKDKLVWATNFQDPTNYIHYELDDKELKISKISEGVRKQIAAALPIGHAAIYTVKLDWRPDAITVSINGGPVRRLGPDSIKNLRAGVFGFIGNRDVRLSDFQYRETQ